MNGLGQQVQAQESSILPTMHDTCIAYKLYAECGRMINLLDWCDAFVSVCEGKHGEQVEERKEKGKGKGKEKGKGKRKGKGKGKENDTDDRQDADEGPEIVDPQAVALNRTRFVRGVAELEYLGFIRPTRRKADHVTKLVFAMKAQHD